LEWRPRPTPGSSAIEEEEEEEEEEEDGDDGHFNNLFYSLLKISIFLKTTQ
jgi:hypothetical protein